MSLTAAGLKLNSNGDKPAIDAAVAALLKLKQDLKALTSEDVSLMSIMDM